MKQAMLSLQDEENHPNNKSYRLINLSSVTLKKNKISKRKFILNSNRKKAKLIYYPTLNLSKRRSNPLTIKKKRATKKFEKIPFQLKYFESLQSKKFSKLENLANSFFQLYSIDEDLTTCNYSVGNLIELSYMGTRKIVLVSTLELEDNLDRVIYTSKRKDQKFLNFFDETSKYNNNSFKENFFKFGKKNYDIHPFSRSCIESLLERLDDFRTHYKISEMEMSCLKRLFMAEVPNEILREIDYESIPKLNLDKSNRNSIENNFVMGFNKSSSSLSTISDVPTNNSKIFLFAQNFKLDNFEKKRNCPEKENLKLMIVNSNLILSTEKLENSGDLNVIYGVSQFTDEILCEFHATCLTNGVGNLIYKGDKSFKPIGINIGTAMNLYNNNVDNVYINLENEIVLNFIKLFLVNLTKDEIIFTFYN